MRTLRLSLAGTVILTLLAGPGGVVLAQSGSDDSLEPPGFPTGTFVGEQDSLVQEFNEDGTGRGWLAQSDYPVSHHHQWTYAVDEERYEQTTFNYVGEPLDSRPPWTYRWHFDGEYLTFEVVGEDPDPLRQQAYEQPHRYVPEPRLAVFAAGDIEAGTKLWMGNTGLRVVPGADAPVDTLTDLDSVTGATATVEIAKGQPITPDMLEPPAE